MAAIVSTNVVVTVKFVRARVSTVIEYTSGCSHDGGEVFKIAEYRLSTGPFLAYLQDFISSCKALKAP